MFVLAVRYPPRETVPLLRVSPDPIVPVAKDEACMSVNITSPRLLTVKALFVGAEVLMVSLETLLEALLTI